MLSGHLLRGIGVGIAVGVIAAEASVRPPDRRLRLALLLQRCRRLETRGRHERGRGAVVVGWGRPHVDELGPRKLPLGLCDGVLVLGGTVDVARSGGRERETCVAQRLQSMCNEPRTL